MPTQVQVSKVRRAFLYHDGPYQEWSFDTQKYTLIMPNYVFPIVDCIPTLFFTSSISTLIHIRINVLIVLRPKYVIY